MENAIKIKSVDLLVKEVELSFKPIFTIIGW
jgi:hypothetical protein